MDPMTAARATSAAAVSFEATAAAPIGFEAGAALDGFAALEGLPSLRGPCRLGRLCCPGKALLPWKALLLSRALPPWKPLLPSRALPPWKKKKTFAAKETITVLLLQLCVLEGHVAAVTWIKLPVLRLAPASEGYFIEFAETHRVNLDRRQAVFGFGPLLFVGPALWCDWNWGHGALEQLRWACAACIPRGVVLMDAGYGADTDLRATITTLGLSYVAGIMPNTSVWAPGKTPLPPKKWSGQGRPPKLRSAGRAAPCGVRPADAAPASAIVSPA